MDPPNPNPNPSPVAGTATSSAPPPSPKPPSPSPQQPPATAATSAASTPTSTSNPNPRPALPPPALPRPWQQPPSLGTSSSPAPPRSGVAIGVPAHPPSPTPPSQVSSFSPSYGHFGGLGRSGVGLPESAANSSTSQVRPSMAGMPGIGMLGPLGSGAQMRPGGIPAHLQQRPVPSSLRPVPSLGSQNPSSQNYHGHGLLRMPSAGSPSGPSPTTSQNLQSINQPWLASGSQGKPPLPSPYRVPPNPQSPQLRPNSQPQTQPQMQPKPQMPPQPQPPHTLSNTPASSQQQLPSSSQSPQAPPSRVPQAFSHQQQQMAARGLVSTSQRPFAQTSVQLLQTNVAQSGPLSKATVPNTEPDEFSHRILGKRSIHELVNQIDPTEKLDSEVEGILMDIAEDFVESITTFGCSLAKHRKSNTLEAKDILLHLERNWNITLPGFAGDEIKTYRKPPVNDVHKERLAVIRKSMLTNEAPATRNIAGQAAGNTKGSMVKTPANAIGSPNFKS